MNFFRRIISVVFICLLAVALAYLITGKYINGWISLINLVYFRYFIMFIQVKSFINEGYDVEYKNVSKKIILFPYINYKNVRIKKGDYLNKILFPTLFIWIVNLSILGLMEKFLDETIGLQMILLSILSFIVGNAFLYKEYLYIIKIILKGTMSYVIFKDNKLSLAAEHNCKYAHREIFELEEHYLKFSMQDLEREKILLESKLEKARKPKFFDRYMIPISIVILGGLLSFVNSMFSIVLSSEGFEKLDWVINMYFLYIFIFSSPFIFMYIIILFMYHDNSHRLKIKLGVVENNIKKHNESENDVHKIKGVS